MKKKSKSKKDQLLISPEKLAIAAGVFIGVFVLIGFFIFLRGGIELRTALAPQSKTIIVTGTVPDGYPTEYVPTVTADAQLSGDTLTVNFDSSQFGADTGYNSEGNVYGYAIKDLIINVNGGDQEVVETAGLGPDGNLETQPSTLPTSYTIPNIDTNNPFTVDVSIKFYFWRKIKMGTIGDGGGSDDCPDKEMSRWACFNNGAMIYYNQDWKDGHLVNGECEYGIKRDWEEDRGGYKDDDDVPCSFSGECKDNGSQVWCEKDGVKANEHDKVQEGPQTDEDWPVFFQIIGSGGSACSAECETEDDCADGLLCVDVNNLGTLRCALDCSKLNNTVNAWPPYSENGCYCNTDGGN